MTEGDRFPIPDTHPRDPADRGLDLWEMIERRDRLIAALREALEPFATHGDPDTWTPVPDDDDEVAAVRVRDWRRACIVLADTLAAPPRTLEDVLAELLRAVEARPAVVRVGPAEAAFGAAEAGLRAELQRLGSS